MTDRRAAPRAMLPAMTTPDTIRPSRSVSLVLPTSILPWWYSYLMPRGHPSPKLAITVDPDVHAGVVAAAEAEGVSVSAWMTAAARSALKLRDGLAAVADWEAEHGELTSAEMAAARERVGGSHVRRSA